MLRDEVYSQHWLNLMIPFEAIITMIVAEFE